jgi:V/A-type H+-transporting ATPase subunit E
MSSGGDLDALVERVLSRAREEAASLVDRARKAADRQVQNAQEHCEAQRRSAQDAADEADGQRLHSVRAGLRQEQRRSEMNACEDAVNEVFADALRALSVIDDAVGRRQGLVALVREAAGALGVTAVRIRLNPAEQSLARTPEFLREFGAVQVTVEDETIETSGGPVVTDESGRMVFENTYEARLDRARDRLRSRVATWLQLPTGEGDR